MLIGLPGCGKTTFVQNNLKDHVNISLKTNEFVWGAFGPKDQKLLERYEQENPMMLGTDIEKTKSKTDMRFAETLNPGTQQSINRRVKYMQITDALDSGKNVTIDDINLTTKEIRWPYIRLAILRNLEIHAILFSNIQQAFERNPKREKKFIAPSYTIQNQFKRFEYPEKSEGFITITKITQGTTQPKTTTPLKPWYVRTSTTKSKTCTGAPTGYCQICQRKHG